MNDKQYGSWDGWNKEWNQLMRFDGSGFDGVQDRIRDIKTLWERQVEPSWLRPGQIDDRRWLEGVGYRRGDVIDPASGEHKIEADILKNLHGVSWLGGSLVDGLSAIPLTRIGRGVEGDLLVLARHGTSYNMHLTEVKVSANHAWYAVVENLRQLRLLQGNAEVFGDEGMCGIFKRRSADIPSGIPVSGVVLGVNEFYGERGQKHNAVAPARELIEALGSIVTLAVWHEETRTAKKLEDSPHSKP